MAVTVPNEEKVYTTVYESFKGVDYTNDPSNVWRRRSPNGLNMLPDLDGRPYKRHGWGIEIPAQRFLDVSGKTGEVKPVKTMYFTIGNTDHLAIFNNLGMFIYANGNLKFIDEYYDGDTAEEFPPSIVVSGATEKLTIDPYRSFFFEGQGTAGFYVYCGMKLFRYDADGKLYIVKPYIPTVLDGCDPETGAGTDGENVNLLTSERTITYFGNGNDTYKLPGGIREGDTSIKISILDLTSGEWGEDLTIGTDFTVSSANGTITFLTGHIPESAVVANVKVTYSPQSSFEPYAHSDSQEFECQSYQHRMTVEVRDAQSYALVTIKTVEAYEQTAGAVNPTGMLQSTDNIRLYYDGAWDDENDFSSLFTLSQNPYTKETSVTHIDASDTSYDERYRVYTNDWNTTSKKSGTIITSSRYPSLRYTIPQTPSGYAILSVSEVGFRYHYTGKVNYTETLYNNKAGTAFEKCSKAIVYGSGLYNQVFFGASSLQDYSTRVWYSAATRPEYMPDLNYIEVGATDVPVAGFIKCDEYLGIVKQNDNMDSSIYLAYATSFEQDTTYAIKQSIGGVGAIANGAFNILNGEPLFLSKNGVMGIELADGFRIRNRSYFVNKKLESEPNLKNAISFVHNNMYYLSVNGHCYVLDGTQKTSWANEKTNLQYEAYYLENIPAQCFARANGNLYFSDNYGNVCRFKNDTDDCPFRDDYDIAYYEQMRKIFSMTFSQLTSDDALWTVGGYDFIYDNGYYSFPDEGETGSRFAVSSLDELPAARYYDRDVVASRKLALIATRESSGEGYALTGYAVYSIDDFQEGESDWEYTVTLKKGVPVHARWSTIADDDGVIHFFKNLQKKGCVVSLLPMPLTGATVSLKADEKDPVRIGEIEFTGGTLPHEFYIKKKLKKYKRLQIICENDDMDSGFGLDQIIKSYTMGNYSKNRG